MFFKGTRALLNLKINIVIKILILSDFVIWSASNLIAPVFAIYLTENINGGSIEVVGLAAMIYLIFKSIFEVPVGMWIDRTKSEKDDLYSALLGTILTGMVYALFPVITEVWQVYVLQAILGVSAALAFPGWYSIFTRHIDKKKEAFEWSLYDVMLGLGMAFTAAIGAFMANRFGFNTVFYIISIATILGAFCLFLIRNKIRQ